MDKQYYIDRFYQQMDEYYEEYPEARKNDYECNVTDAVDTVDSVVGYYIVFYGDNARETWVDNISNIEKLTQLDLEVSKILDELYK